MNKIESFKYIRPISLSATSCYSIGDLLPIEISWECNGSMYNRKQEKGGLCAILSEHDNVIGVVENPYMGGFNSAYVLNGTNQIIWNVSDLFMVGSINSIFYFLHKAAEPFNCLEQDNLA